MKKNFDEEIILWTLFLLLTMCLFYSCKTKTVFVPVKQTHIEKEYIRDTVVQVKLEKEYVKQTTRSRYSFLETKYAESNAMFDSITGMLSHDLKTKNDSIPVRIKVVHSVTIDSIPAPYPIYVDRPIEKPVRMSLRWWEKSFMYLGMVSVGVGIAGIYFKLKK